jgi:hypothetical protein
VSTIAQLISLLEAAQTDLELALADGEETASFRTEIARIEAAITEMRGAEVEALRQQGEQEKVDVRAATVALTESQHDMIEAATIAPELVELGETIPAIDIDPLIAAAAHDVALAKSALDKAEVIHRRLQANVDKFRARISEEQAKVEAIKTRRADGNRRDDDAGAMTLLEDDIAGLQRLFSSAQTKADEANPHIHCRELEVAQNRMDMVRGEAQLRVSDLRLRLAEQAFLRAYADQRAAERVVGLHLNWPSGTYRADREFKNIVTRH